MMQLSARTDGQLIQSILERNENRQTGGGGSISGARRCQTGANKKLLCVYGKNR